MDALCGCLIMVMLVVAPTLWVILVRRRRRQANPPLAAGGATQIDGARIEQPDSTTIVFKPQRGRNLLLTAVLGLFSLLAALALVSGLQSGRLLENNTVDLCIFPAVAILLGAATYTAARGLVQPAIHFDGARSMLVLSTWRQTREIPLLDVDSIGFSVHEVPMYTSNLTRIRLEAILKSGETVRLGTLSGKKETTRQRAGQILSQIRQLMGWPVGEGPV